MFKFRSTYFSLKNPALQDSYRFLVRIANLFRNYLNLSDTQRLLDIGQKPRLYPRVRYDAAIIYGLEEKMTLEQMNSFLDEIEEETLL